MITHMTIIHNGMTMSKATNKGLAKRKLKTKFKFPNQNQ